MKGEEIKKNEGEKRKVDEASKNESAEGKEVLTISGRIARKVLLAKKKPLYLFSANMLSRHVRRLLRAMSQRYFTRTTPHQEDRTSTTCHAIMANQCPQTPSRDS
ncbi:hypothetical protein CR513_09495, partial [Mucuna pruriens]